MCWLPLPLPLPDISQSSAGIRPRNHLLHMQAVHAGERDGTAHVRQAIHVPAGQGSGAHPRNGHLPQVGGKFGGGV